MSHWATASPIACDAVCEMLIDQDDTWRLLATYWACPCKRNCGAPESCVHTSISCQLIGPMPLPSAFATASFTAKRPASRWMLPSHTSCSCGVKIRSRKRCPCRSMAVAMRSTSMRSIPDKINERAGNRDSWLRFTSAVGDRGYSSFRKMGRFPSATTSSQSLSPSVNTAATALILPPASVTTFFMASSVLPVLTTSSTKIT